MGFCKTRDEQFPRQRFVARKSSGIDEDTWLEWYLIPPETFLMDRNFATSKLYVCKCSQIGGKDEKRTPEESFLAQFRLCFYYPGFKCSDRWLTCFLKNSGFSADLTNHSGPEIQDHRGWVDLIRPMITEYKHEDLFHTDELTMYSDIRPSKMETCSEGSEGSRNRITILMGCNSSGTIKLPLLICGPYSSKIKEKEHVYCRSEDSYIGDELFKDWLSNVNDRMRKCNRRVLLFLRRTRAYALKDFPAASNLQLVYLPEDFPPLLRPLRGDVFHYVKMVFRRRYVERVKDYTTKWELPDILASLIEAWQTLPRELIIFNFQRTRFRTDDSLLQINYDSWDSLKMGMSFKRFVTFDDDLSNDKVTHETDNPWYHDYNLRICEDRVLENRGKIEEAKARNYRKTIPPLELGNRTDRKLDYKIVKSRKKMVNDKHRNAKPSSLKGNLIERNTEQRKSLKRTYSETQFFTKGRRGDRRVFGDKNIKNSFLPKDRNVGPSRSIRGKVFEEEMPQRHQPEVNIIRVSLQAIIDKALTLTSSANAEYTKKLINNIYASNQETANRRFTQSKHLNKQDSLESRCMNLANKKMTKVATNLPGNLFDEFNQPSSSTSNLNILWEGIEQSASMETTESQAILENSNPTRNNGDDTVLQEDLSFSVETRRKSPDVNDSEDASDSNGPGEDKSKTDHNWSKQFETSFIFGSPATNCSLNHQPHENMVDPCILNVRSSISPRE